MKRSQVDGRNPCRYVSVSAWSNSCNTATYHKERINSPLREREPRRNNPAFDMSEPSAVEGECRVGNLDIDKSFKAGAEQVCALAWAFIEKHHALTKQEGVEQHSASVRV